jgi:glycosyltransferase involved in cell wall biosynthesis
MRVAIASHTGLRTGGVESYLAGLIPGLAARGHDVACLFEETASGPHAILPPSHRGAVWTCGAEPARALDALREWRPEAVYLHGFRSVALERQLTRVAPVVFFAHSYYGACISGERSTRFPVIAPCDRTFGPACLARYFPQQCGGRNPITMARQYAVQRTRQHLLEAFAAVLVASAHMQRTYERLGVPARRIVFPAAPAGVATRGGGDRWNLLFVGRLERSKGLDVLLESSAWAAERLDRPVRLLIAGEGSRADRARREAARLTSLNPRFTVEFPGWIDDAARSAAFSSADLLLIPSTWPEPFGLAGVEAASAGVPAIAFDVGGIPAWLSDGVNGRLVPFGRDAAARYGDAILGTLSDSARLAQMRIASAAAAGRFTMAAHLDALEPCLLAAAGTAPAAESTA